MHPSGKALRWVKIEVGGKPKEDEVQAMWSGPSDTGTRVPPVKPDDDSNAEAEWVAKYPNLCPQCKHHWNAHLGGRCCGAECSCTRSAPLVEPKVDIKPAEPKVKVESILCSDCGHPKEWHHSDGCHAASGGFTRTCACTSPGEQPKPVEEGSYPPCPYCDSFRLSKTPSGYVCQSCGKTATRSVEKVKPKPKAEIKVEFNCHCCGHPCSHHTHEGGCQETVGTGFCDCVMNEHGQYSQKYQEPGNNRSPLTRVWMPKDLLERNRFQWRKVRGHFVSESNATAVRTIDGLVRELDAASPPAAEKPSRIEDAFDKPS